MLTTKEKRFIKYWEEQRVGGRWKYYLLYILAGTFISSIVLAFLSAMVAFGFPENIVWIVSGSFVIVTISTLLAWRGNEKKFKAIIKREVREGKQKSAASQSEN